MATVEWEQVRQAGTVGDLMNSAMATIGVASKALAALDKTTVAQINRLHELETGAAGLFDKAEALDDLASQAAGDRAAALYRQAQEARAEAERQQAAAEKTQAKL